jgi:hypothetical protein
MEGDKCDIFYHISSTIIRNRQYPTGRTESPDCGVVAEPDPLGLRDR